jgi:predicted TIM-barrel fold metal-dependent hydrolase
MSELTRRALLAGAAIDAMAADYRILDPHVHVWKHDAAFPFAQGANVPARDAAPENAIFAIECAGHLAERTI